MPMATLPARMGLERGRRVEGGAREAGRARIWSAGMQAGWERLPESGTERPAWSCELVGVLGVPFGDIVRIAVLIEIEHEPIQIISKYCFI
jgi:hypothetical protein